VQLTTGAAHPNAGEALTIRLVNLDAAAGIEVNFDDVRLDATPLAVCAAVPLGGCKTATAGKGSLSLSRKVGDPTKNALAWTWKGQATSFMELGTPTSTTSYRLCAYDGADTVVLDLPVAAGGPCGTKPCWKATTKSYAYKSKLGNAAGVTAVALKSGADGKAAVSMKAKGASLVFPTLPLVQTPDPVRVLLVNEATNTCWIAAYSTPPKDPSSTVKWKVKND
jgi:hypothetical protein